ncbi:MAG: reverse transcriptase domain-containing protein [Cyanobacteriota bacterium]|jgi:RNA-directed DNA polymerase
MVKQPPPLRDLYFRITAFPTLLGAFRKASKGKRYRPEVLAFGANLEAELFQLQQELRSFVYSPGPYRQFTIREPKPRLVSAAPFRDRVVHHALIAVIAPPLERHFVRTSYANRHGYGSHRALRRFARACREHPWVLQADIRLYFPSIDHQLLLAQLERRIACRPTLWLLRAILANGASAGPAIDAFPGDDLLTPLQRPRGLPIGNLTSQFLANLHLDPIDHRLRSLPGVRAYLRYVDDLSLFADHPETLRHSLTVLRTELHALRLRLHPSKTQIRRTATGASFVGFHLIGGRIRLRNHSLLRIRRGLRRHSRNLPQGRISAARARASALSWDAHLAHGHTLLLRRQLFAPYPFAAGLPTDAALR